MSGDKADEFLRKLEKIADRHEWHISSDVGYVRTESGRCPIEVVMGWPPSSVAFRHDPADHLGVRTRNKLMNAADGINANRAPRTRRRLLKILDLEEVL